MKTIVIILMALMLPLGQLMISVPEAPEPAAVEAREDGGTRYGFRELSRGDSGDDVLALQTRLYMLGFYLNDIDGEFDGYTQTAVKLFQSYECLEVTGCVDAETLKRVWAEDASVTDYNYWYWHRDELPETLRLGDSGMEVLELQARLYMMGFLSDIGGEFDGPTQTAVKLFQACAGLPVTGVVDAETRAALRSDGAPMSEYNRLPTDEA